MIPNLELNIQPHYQSRVRDEIQTFPHMQDFKCSLPMYPFLRRMHETGEPRKSYEGKTRDDNYATGLENHQSIHETRGREITPSKKKKETDKKIRKGCILLREELAIGRKKTAKKNKDKQKKREVDEG